MTGELSPTMSRLLDIYKDLEERIERDTKEFERVNESEAHRHILYLKAKAEAILEAQGTVQEKDATATLKTIKLLSDYEISVGYRRAVKDILNARVEQLRTLQASFHAYNRELKELRG